MLSLTLATFSVDKKVQEGAGVWGCAAIDLKWGKFPWVTHGTDLRHPSHGCLMGLI